MTNLSPTTRRPAYGLFQRSAPGSLHGFTIMELLIVISIIAVIAALLLGGVTALRGGAQEAQTRTLLAGLMGLEGQYQVQFKSGTGVPHLVQKGSSFNWNDKDLNRNVEGDSSLGKLDDASRTDQAGDESSNYTYDNGDTNDEYMERANLYIERFLWAANQMPVIREKLPTLGQAFGDADNDGFIDIVDPWGNPIAYANNVQHITDKDEQDDFLPEYKGPFFASAGKDQRWGRPRTSGEFATRGNWNAYKQTEDYKFTLDNLYSFDIDRSAAQRGD